MMAVLVMASCGGSSDKKSDSAQTGGDNQEQSVSSMTQPSQKVNPGQVIDKIIVASQTLLDKGEQAIRADDAEIIVSAFEKYADQMVDVYNKYSDVLSNMSPEEQQKNMDKAYEMMSLLEEIQGLEYELNQLDASPSQMKRLMKAVEKLEVLN